MLKSLYAKLSVTLFFIFSLLAILSVTLTFSVSDLYQQEVMQKLNRKVASHIVSDTQVFAHDKINRQALRNLFHSLMILHPSLEIYFLDPAGNILEYSAPPWKVVRLSVDVKPIQQFLKSPDKLPIFGDDPKKFQHKKIFSVAAVYDNNKISGYLYVILGGEEFDSVVERIKSSYILKNSLVLTGLGLVLALILGMLIFFALTQRLKKLAETVKNFETDPVAPVPAPSETVKGDEIDQLTHAFFIMANTIQTQLEELQRKDQLRRELVANVSHDLRTPLTTLQGFIETLMLKNQSLEAAERLQYLQTAINHCHKINKLVGELFELAKLDANGVQPNCEIFNLAELVEDVVQKFSLQARHKKISLKSHYDSRDLFVFADIALIERALDNLLENALRFTREQGAILIELNLSDKHITVKVHDDGIGIPAEQLPFIFDRFFQLDDARSADLEHSGLGLAIVKKIINLHQSVINVASIPNQQTIFSFDLPLHTPGR